MDIASDRLFDLQNYLINLRNVNWAEKVNNYYGCISLLLIFNIQIFMLRAPVGCLLAYEK